MPRRALPVLAAVALSAEPAGAQQSLAVPTQVTLEQMCSPSGAHGYAFGQADVPGGDRMTRAISTGIALPSSAAPFDYAKPWSTEWSNRLFGVEFTADEPADTQAFARFAAELDRRLEPAGWQLQPDGFDPPLYLITLAGDWTWLRPVATEQGPTQLVLGLSSSALGITLSCGRADLAETHANEAFGNLPPGTPRPQVPNIPVPSLRTVADCDKPEVASEISTMLGRGAIDSFAGSMIARTTYRDRLTTWMAWRLEQSGKIAPDDLIDLSLSAIGSASPGGDPFAQFGMIEEMFSLLRPLAEADQAGDAAALCRGMLPLQDWFTRVDALTLKQTEAIQAALTDAAVRLGVSFD